MVFFNPKILMTSISASQPKPLKKKTQYQETKNISVKRLQFGFSWDLAAVRFIGVSVIARCPQGESWL